MRSKWIIFFPIALFALFSPQSAEATQTGLLVRGYTITDIPPTKSDTAYELCGSTVLTFINATWDYEPFEQCGWDSFMLHYTGFLQIPEHQTIEFFIASDDGGTVKIGQEEFGIWQDQGCSATVVQGLNFKQGTYALDAWMYENGGGTCFMLAWNIDDTGWQIVSPEYFTNEPLVVSTTTVVETTIDATTTTAVSTTSTSTTAVPLQQTTTIEETTTTTSTTTTSSTTTSTIVLVLPVELPQSTEQVSTTSTSIPSPDSTLTTIAVPVTTSTTVFEPIVTTTLAEPTTTLAEPAIADQPLDEALFVAVLEELNTATATQIVAAVGQLLAYELTNEQATRLVTSPEVLAAINGDQAQQLFAQVDVSEIDAVQLEILVAAVQEAPTEVRTAFEEEINIFGGYTDTYVPLGSSVTVSVRRSLIAASATLSVMAAPVVATKRDTNVGISKR